MHLDITFGLQVGEISSLVSVPFREALSHPYISLLSFTTNGFSVIYIGICVYKINCNLAN